MAAHPPPLAAPDLGLALAVIASSVSPLLLLDEDLRIVAASASFCEAFQILAEQATGRSLPELNRGEWKSPQLQALLAATASGGATIRAYEMDLTTEVHGRRRLVVNAHKLAYGDVGPVLLVVALTDVTDLRAADKRKDDLVREKAILLQELQHRVANSLQIIASVLLQNARTVQSDETRLHLRDAHNRVMSVAALQQQLAISTLSDVELRPYLTQLCRSIGASMIHDPAQISITVMGDDSATAADVSVSLGLIVTELVINALKHAFPGRRHGKIAVSYRAYGPSWTLRVSDDGVGMPEGAAIGKPGLGTSIVEALARQLGAKVVVAGANPGTTVSIVRSHLTAVKPQAEPDVA
jgi:two-component system, sensor histidine kinase PdtaS